MEKWRGPTSSTDHGEDQDEVADGVDEQEAEADTSQASIASAGMDVDEDASLQAIAHEAEGANLVGEGDDVESDDDDAEDPSNVAMVPMADMLNARYGSENVCFHIRAHVVPPLIRWWITTGEALLRAERAPDGCDKRHSSGGADRASSAPRLNFPSLLMLLHMSTYVARSGIHTVTLQTQTSFVATATWTLSPIMAARQTLLSFVPISLSSSLQSVPVRSWTLRPERNGWSGGSTRAAMSTNLVDFRQ